MSGFWSSGVLGEAAGAGEKNKTHGAHGATVGSASKGAWLQEAIRQSVPEGTTQRDGQGPASDDASADDGERH
jgi:hypothetical protein